MRPNPPSSKESSTPLCLRLRKRSARKGHCVSIQPRGENVFSLRWKNGPMSQRNLKNIHHEKNASPTCSRKRRCHRPPKGWVSEAASRVGRNSRRKGRSEWQQRGSGGAASISWRKAQCHSWALGSVSKGTDRVAHTGRRRARLRSLVKGMAGATPPSETPSPPSPKAHRRRHSAPCRRRLGGP